VNVHVYTYVCVYICRSIRENEQSGLHFSSVGDYNIHVTEYLMCFILFKSLGAMVVVSGEQAGRILSITGLWQEDGPNFKRQYLKSQEVRCLNSLSLKC